MTDECRDISELFVVICQEIVGENMGGVHVIIISSAAQHSLSIRSAVVTPHMSYFTSSFGWGALWGFISSYLYYSRMNQMKYKMKVFRM